LHWFVVFGAPLQKVRIPFWALLKVLSTRIYVDMFASLLSDGICSYDCRLNRIFVASDNCFTCD